MGSGAPPASASAFFNSDLMLSTGWGQVTYPAAIHVASTNKTYVTWEFVGLDGYKGIHIASYDHTAGSWSERYTVGNFLLANDDHGVATLVRDANGYIHCFYGSHRTPQMYSVTNAPDDISTWTQRPDIGTTLTYPKPVLVGSKIYLFAREAAVSTNLKMTLFTATPVAGIATWAAAPNLVDFGADSRVYIAEAHAVGTNIHLVCTRSDSADTIRRGVYYFVYNTVTGGVTNFDGSFTVASGSLPVTLTQSNTNFRIYDHGSNDGDLGSFQFDTSGNAHIIFADGLTPTYDLKHMMLSGGAWSSPTTIATLDDLYAPTFGFVSNYTLVAGASGKMEAWYNNSSGDKMRRVRSAAGTWAAAGTIKTAGTFDLLQGAAVKDADSSMRAFFAENTGSTTDSAAANLSMFAYGDGGPVNDTIDMTAVDPAGFSNVVLLLGCRHRNGAVSIIDESKSSLRVALAGNAQIDTSQTPFPGGASLKLDGANDYVTVLNNSAFSASGTSDFSIRGWFRPNELARLQVLLSKRSPSGTAHDFMFYLNPSNQLQFLAFNNNAVALNLIGTTALATGAWYFYEFNRIGGTGYLLYGPLGGTVALEASGAQASAPTASSQALLIGRDPSTPTTRDLNGWLADIEFTRAGRHTAAFAAPTTWAPRR
jgi:hypothetical protein